MTAWPWPVWALLAAATFNLVVAVCYAWLSLRLVQLDRRLMALQLVLAQLVLDSHRYQHLPIWRFWHGVFGRVVVSLERLDAEDRR